MLLFAHTKKQQFVIAPSSSGSDDFLDHIVVSIRAHNNDNEPLIRRLGTFAGEKEQALQELCNEDRARELIASIANLKTTQTHIVALTKEILKLKSGIDRTTRVVVVKGKELVDVQTRVRFNVAESLKQIDSCMDLLLQARKCRECLGGGRYIAALQKVEDIESKLAFDENDIVDTSGAIVQFLSLMMPATRSQIVNDTLSHLHDWLTHIREEQQDNIGTKALKNTLERKERLIWEAQTRKPFLKFFLINSAVELSLAEADEEKEDLQAALNINFTPLLECIHIQSAFGGLDAFRAEYATLRERQMEGFLARKSIKLSLAGRSAGGQERQPSDIRSLLESIAGFMIVEQCTAGKVPRFRSREDV